MRSKGSGAAAGSSWRLVTWPAPTTTGTCVQSVTDRSGPGSGEVELGIDLCRQVGGPEVGGEDLLGLVLWGCGPCSEVSTSVASARRAATVHCSRGRTLKGS